MTRPIRLQYRKNILRPIRLAIQVGLFIFQSVLLSSGQPAQVQVKILGIAQDAGYPQVGCQSECCALAWANPKLRRSPVCLGIIDHNSSKSWLVEATPDLKDQWQVLTGITGTNPDGILITHAHTGHYTGLMQMGREMMNTHRMPLMVLPRMAQFLRDNGPWSQLIAIGNIEIQQISADSTFDLSSNLRCQAIIVPHRDEYSETAAFIFSGPSKKLLFVPDIDKWEKWEKDIRNLIAVVDFALIDGTFFQDRELKNRAMSEIPHPFVTESLSLFNPLPLPQRQKIYFIHFNHTNPLIRGDHNAIEQVRSRGMNVASQGMTLNL